MVKSVNFDDFIFHLGNFLVNFRQFSRQIRRLGWWPPSLISERNGPNRKITHTFTLRPSVALSTQVPDADPRGFLPSAALYGYHHPVLSLPPFSVHIHVNITLLACIIVYLFPPLLFDDYIICLQLSCQARIAPPPPIFLLSLQLPLATATIHLSPFDVSVRSPSQPALAKKEEPEKVLLLLYTHTHISLSILSSSHLLGPFLLGQSRGEKGDLCRRKIKLCSSDVHNVCLQLVHARACVSVSERGGVPRF